MTRGKRITHVTFMQAPEVPFVSFVLKVLKRQGWPAIFEGQAGAGLVKGYIAYIIAGIVAERFREEMFWLRSVACKIPDGKDTMKSMEPVYAGALSDFSGSLVLDDPELEEIATITGDWIPRLERALARAIKKNRFHSDAIIFREHWGRILEKEQDGGSPRYASAFYEWQQETGWKFGVHSADYDRLIARCVLEDSYLNKEYIKFGLGSFEDFLSQGPFSQVSRKVFRHALASCVEKNILRVLDKKRGGEDHQGG